MAKKDPSLQMVNGLTGLVGHHAPGHVVEVSHTKTASVITHGIFHFFISLIAHIDLFINYLVPF